MLHHALHRTGNGVSAAAGERIAGVGGEQLHLPRGHMQAGGAGLQRAQHDAVPGQDQTTQKFAIGINRFHRDCGAHHDHHHGAWRALTQHAVVGPHHGDPAVRT